MRSRAVDPHTLEAIDSARGIENLAAHMERDTSSIVDVEPAAMAALNGNDENSLLSWLMRETQRAGQTLLHTINPDAPVSPIAITDHYDRRFLFSTGDPVAQ